MSKYFKDNGFLSEEGEELVADFKSSLSAMLVDADMSQSELQTLGSNLSKLVGDAISNTIQAKSELKKSSVTCQTCSSKSI